MVRVSKKVCIEAPKQLWCARLILKMRMRQSGVRSSEGLFPSDSDKEYKGCAVMTGGSRQHADRSINRRCQILSDNL